MYLVIPLLEAAANIACITNTILSSHDPMLFVSKVFNSSINVCSPPTICNLSCPRSIVYNTLNYV